MPDGPDRVRQPWAAVGEFFEQCPVFGVIVRILQSSSTIRMPGSSGVHSAGAAPQGDADPQPSVRIGPTEATRSASAGITEGLSLAANALAHTYWVAYALGGVTVVAALFSSPQGRGIASAG
jgi:hypothetical protein